MGLKVLSAKIWSFCISLNELTHLPLDKMAAISQTIFSDAFWWIKSFIFWLKFHWSLLLRVQLTITQDCFRQWLGAGQATSHYLNQWWLVYWYIYSSLSLKELISNSLPQGVSSRLVNYTCQVKWQGPGGVFHQCFQSSPKYSLEICVLQKSYFMRSSSWYFARVPKAILWEHVQSFSLKFSPYMWFLALTISARLF